MAKRLTAQQKLQLVIEALKGDVNASQLCRKADIWPTQLNRYKKKALEGALETLNSCQSKKPANYYAKSIKNVYCTSEIGITAMLFIAKLVSSNYRAAIITIFKMIT